jgi:molybdopterin molybdotransferase
VSPLLTVSEALAAVLARAAPLPAEEIPLASAAGRFLAAPLSSVVDLPPFPSSSMDGYAVIAADIPGVLSVVDHSAAGHPASRRLDSGQAIEISTGAVVPDGADTVVQVERVIVRDGQIEIPDELAKGGNIRARGGDVRAGDEILPPGVELTAARIAAAAACGIAHVRVHRAPRVVVVATGSELRPPGEPLGPGQIYESNGIMLVTALRAAGAIVELSATAEDSEEALERTLAAALSADVVVTSGGVSVGPHDLVRRVEERLGVEEVFWGVAMRPGKPLAFAVRAATLVFGLPGNPVSSLVSSLLFVKPALLAMQGHPDPAPRFRPGRLAREVRPRLERDDYMRARVAWDDDGAVIDPILGQESHMIVHTTAADAIVHVPSGADPLPAGARVGYLALDA